MGVLFLNCLLFRLYRCRIFSKGADSDTTQSDPVKGQISSVSKTKTSDSPLFTLRRGARGRTRRRPQPAHLWTYYPLVVRTALRQDGGGGQNTDPHLESSGMVSYWCTAARRGGHDLSPPPV